MKTYKLDAYAIEYYKSSNDLIIEIETEHMMYARRFLVKTSSFEAFEAQETLNDIPDYSILGYVHAQIVDENADSLLLNLPHPYTGEDNLFRVEKEDEEVEEAEDDPEVEEAEDDPEVEILKLAEKIINKLSPFMELFSKCNPRVDDYTIPMSPKRSEKDFRERLLTASTSSLDALSYQIPGAAPRAIAQSDDSYRNYLLRYLECRDTPQKY